MLDFLGHNGYDTCHHYKANGNPCGIFKPKQQVAQHHRGKTGSRGKLWRVTGLQVHKQEAGTWRHTEEGEGHPGPARGCDAQRRKAAEGAVISSCKHAHST